MGISILQRFSNLRCMPKKIYHLILALTYLFHTWPYKYIIKYIVFKMVKNIIFKSLPCEANGLFYFVNQENVFGQAMIKLFLTKFFFFCSKISSCKIKFAIFAWNIVQWGQFCHRCMIADFDSFGRIIFDIQLDLDAPFSIELSNSCFSRK